MLSALRKHVLKVNVFETPSYNIGHYSTEAGRWHTIPLLQLPQFARQYLQPGQEVEIDLDNTIADSAQNPDLSMIAALDEIAKRQEGRSESDGSQTLDFIREARDGAMYDYNPGQ